MARSLLVLGFHNLLKWDMQMRVQVCDHGQAAIMLQTSCGLRFCSTRPSMMEGSWASTSALQVASRSGRICPRALQIWTHIVTVGRLSRLVCSGCYLLDKVNNLLLGGVWCDEVVDVSDDVHTDGASEIVLRLGGGGGQQAGEEGKSGLHCDVGWGTGDTGAAPGQTGLYIPSLSRDSQGTDTDIPGVTSTSLAVHRPHLINK